MTPEPATARKTASPALIPCPVCRTAGVVGFAALVAGCPACSGARWLRVLTPDRGPVGRLPWYRRP